MSASDKHPIFYLISGPRSLSTAFLRMMHARGDCEVFNEPSVSAYEYEVYPDVAPTIYKPSAPRSWSAVKEMLYRAAEKRPVFAKEMSYGVHEFLRTDSAFVRDPRVHFLFLARDPHSIAISFYKKGEYPPEALSDVVGSRQLWNLFELVRDQSPNGVHVVRSEFMGTHAREMATALCRHLGIPFLEHCLEWCVLPDTFTGEVEWNEQKVQSEVLHWHRSAMRSTCFSRVPQYDVDARGSPTFSEIVNEDHRQKVHKAWLENVPYYKKLVSATDDLKNSI
eukprot:TRINITY_DN5918_c0_g1_i1.p1 TRINITY_DN5918_c0_g1~~TRINITY_DN5918_c0_g1_i1.p1  ORF type:complete len:280 (+),score=105.20 TRINITY_DN5918_c0_g1_i1:210-1049(+)